MLQLLLWWYLLILASMCIDVPHFNSENACVEAAGEAGYIHSGRLWRRLTVSAAHLRRNGILSRGCCLTCEFGTNHYSFINIITNMVLAALHSSIATEYIIHGKIIPQISWISKNWVEKEAGGRIWPLFAREEIWWTIDSMHAMRGQ